MSTTRAHAPASPAQTTSYGQVIEYIQSTYDSPESGLHSYGLNGSILISAYRSSISRIVHPPTKRAHSLSLPCTTTTHQTLLKIALKTVFKHPIYTYSSASGLLYRRRRSVIQSFSRRFWPITHWTSVPLFCNSP